MALSRIVAFGDGTTTQFAIPFALGYIRRSDITCRVGTEQDGAGNPIYRTLTWISDELVDVALPVVANGVRIEFTRTTSRTTLLVDYEDGDIINEENMNIAQKQALMLVHETLDGRFEQFQSDFDLGGFRITRLGDPILATDAATKQYVDALIPTGAGNAAAAASSAAAALASANASAASAGVAAGHASAADAARATAVAAAAAIATTAGGHAAAASTSAASAATSASNSAADRTQTGLDRIATAADRVQTGLDRVQTGQDKTATAADRVQTGLDKVATAADRVQTGLDKTATAADRVQTGLDRAAAAASASSINMPASPVALNYLRRNAGNTAYEVRTPAQVADDIDALRASVAQTFTQTQKGQIAANGGHTWEQIGAQIVLGANAASIDWTGLSAYRSLRLSGHVAPVTADVPLAVRWGVAGVYDATASYVSTTIYGSGSTTSTGSGTTTYSAVVSTPSGASVTGRGGDIDAMIFDFNKVSLTGLTSKYKSISAAGLLYAGTVVGYLGNSVAHDSLRLSSSDFVGLQAGSYVTLEGMRG